LSFSRTKLLSEMGANQRANVDSKKGWKLEDATVADYRKVSEKTKAGRLPGLRTYL